MNKVIVFAIIISLLGVGCKKNTDSTNQHCAWFPIYDKTSVSYLEVFTYLYAGTGPVSATVTASVANKTILNIDGYEFTLQDCESGKITLSYGTNIKDMLAIDKNAAEGTVLSSNSYGRFEVRNYMGNKSFLYIPGNGQNTNPTIRIIYKDDIGISTLTINNAPYVIKDYYLQ